MKYVVDCGKGGKQFTRRIGDILQVEVEGFFCKLELSDSELESFGFMRKPEPKIEFGDTVEVVSISPSKTGTFLSSWERHIGKKGKWEPSEYKYWEGKIDGAYFNLSDLKLISKAEKPAPHVWAVGQYAECPDGKVHKVKKVDKDMAGNEKITTYKFGEVYTSQCTPVPEPPRPELPLGWKLHDDGRLSFVGETNKFLGVPNTLEAQIAFFQSASSIYKMDVIFLIALDDWRKLTGRMS